MSNGFFRAVVCVSFFLLAACGGGGSGKSVDLPPPPPPPPPPPTLPATTSQTFETVAVTRELEGSERNISGQITVSARPSTVRVSYDASAGTYTIVETDPPPGSSGTDIFSTATRTTSGYFDTYSLPNGSELSLLGNMRAGGPQAGMPFQLTHLTFGIWTRPNPDGDAEPQYQTYVLFGYPTGSSSMPVTGSASYQTMVNATMFQGGINFLNTETQLNGTATFTADFGAGAISTNLDFGQSVGIFAGTGQIQGANQFAGTFTSDTPYFNSGNFAGGFFGPAAAEMGYVFKINKYNPDPYAGATIQPMHTYITGAVVGRKQ